MKNKTNKRVVITGLGVVSSIGIGIEEFWPNLLVGKSGISKVESFDTSQYERHFAGEIKNFDPTQFMNARRASQIGRASQMAIAASKMALQDAGFSKTDIKKARAGVCIGTTMAEAQNIEAYNDNFAKTGDVVPDNLLALFYPANSISVNIANEFKLSGKNIAFANACASGNYALGQCYDLIRRGECDFMFAGGADALSRIAFTGFGRLFAMAPEKCQPFDLNRKGMLLGEGAGILFLESLESAQKRNARIYAEIKGYGLSCDAHHITQPKREGIAKGIDKALKNAKIDAKEVDYICAHGTGTPENDRSESGAIKDVFVEGIKNIPVNSIKSMLGHTMGAASAIEAINCCKSVKSDVIAPTINLEEKDPECEVVVVANEKIEKNVNVALNNASAFGGNNCCVVFKKVA